ncbi:MAG: GNAT family N-acetyltransferase [Gemmatimonadales bacterium]
MPDLIVRDALPDDAAALSPILAALNYPADEDTIRARMIALRANDPGGRILVAESRGRLLGFATLHCTPTLHRQTSVGRITGISVVEESRGTGAGRALVEAAEEHFRRLGLGRIEVTSGPLHQRAHSFYRHLAYEDQGVRFAKALT